MLSESLRESLDLTLFWEYRFILFKGLSMSLGVFACAALLALAGGLIAALMRVSRQRALRWAGVVHVEVSRNAPDYIMVVWVHFVLPLLLGALIGRRLEFNPFVSALIALGFVYQGHQHRVADRRARPDVPGVHDLGAGDAADAAVHRRRGNLFRGGVRLLLSAGGAVGALAREGVCMSLAPGRPKQARSAARAAKVFL